MNKKLSDEEIFSMLKKESIKVPEGLDQEILAKLNSSKKKVNIFTTRIKIYSVAATIILALLISINLMNLRSPIKDNTNVVEVNTGSMEEYINYDIFNDDELLLAYDELYNEGFDVGYDLIDEDQDIFYEDELYEDIAFLENM
ncbi:MAG: hypothetical protein KAS62_05060 [Candidatus Delongbacteria bacterium]|nr:hypothetical protein [Candidatus Delongbacteria bacterium]